MPTLQNVRKENVLAADELLTHVILPAPGSGQERALRSPLQGVARLAARVRHRRADDERRHDQSARVVLGAVAPVPWRSQAAERRSSASRINEETAAAAAEAALRDARPLSQNAYKVQVAKTAVKRAILHAAGIQTV